MPARAAIPVQTMDRHIPIEPTQTQALVADYHYFVNDGRTFLFIIGGTANCEIYIVTPGTVDGAAIADITFDITLGATEFRIMGPFPPGVYNQSDGTVHVNTEDANVANVKLAAIRMPA